MKKISLVMLTVFGLFAGNELLEEYAGLSQEERRNHYLEKYSVEFEECKKNFQKQIDEDVERIRRCFSGSGWISVPVFPG